jgi:hypothetical protein
MYQTISALIGTIVGICVWIYACFAWGLLVGLAVGWLPAVIAGGIAAFIWPAVLAIIIIFAATH